MNSTKKMFRATGEWSPIPREEDREKDIEITVWDRETGEITITRGIGKVKNPGDGEEDIEITIEVIE